MIGNVVYLETKLRNLKRSYAKAINYAALTDDAELLRDKIKSVEEMLKS